jgi:hypothetical protein
MKQHPVLTFYVLAFFLSAVLLGLLLLLDLGELFFIATFGPGLASSLWLGLLWGLWHTPIFFVHETIQGVLGAQIGLVPGVALFTFLSMCSSVLYTWIFNHTQGSVLIAGLFHGAVNAWLGYFIVDMAYASQIIGAMTMVTLVAALLLAVALGPRLRWRSLTVSS